MALPTIENVTNQMLNESVREQPSVNMKGNVTRPMLVADLLKAMRDVNFKQLVDEYGSMAGIRTEEATPMTTALMAERPRVPETPKETAQPAAPAPVVDEIAEPINVPTPMGDAMANQTMSPTNSIINQNVGLMSNGTQQTA
tara:strand:- start:122 stop:547 length:426 start_codon:yes stop_codon:yes gene_type:complete